jgi:hypothetical protein
MKRRWGIILLSACAIVGLVVFGAYWFTDLRYAKNVPLYMNLPSGKGLEVHAWEEGGSMVYGLRMGTNRMIFPQEIEAMRQHPISFRQMETILSSYDETFISIYADGLLVDQIQIAREQFVEGNPQHQWSGGGD